eukprot:CAMPEP_0197541180 /NCGR_PEP_ID=MMETSP1318-20131121/67018_1 /TAXON_ID=552666 /ORGANISM="Partenskyella glossopodia, Strain RCC365" /LENGTH=527 /DNA_ID=CAMNT_0043100329 /DNA_START=825 /DNA_END=2408 /DNA_ORIENTATION=+
MMLLTFGGRSTNSTGGEGRRIQLNVVVDPEEDCKAKAYLYTDLTISGSSDISLGDGEIWGENIGSNSDGRLTNMNQQNLGGAIIQKLLNGNRCRTLDPKEASIFIVPMYEQPLANSTPDEAIHYDFAPPSDRAHLDQLIDRILSFDWRQLPHLTEETAKKHTILAPGFDGLYGFLYNQHTRKFTGSDIRSAYEQVVGPIIPAIATKPELRPLSKFLWLQNENLGEGLPLRNVVHPNPGSVHTHNASDPDRLKPWKYSTEKKRKHLMAWGGSKNGMEWAKRIRSFLTDECSQRIGLPVCAGISAEVGETFNEGDTMGAAMRLKNESTFCLEPPGYGWLRKSVTDSLTFGCIPVFFHRMSYTQLEDFWPLELRKDMSVLIDGDELMEGKISLLETLKSIPKERIEHMQKTISEYGHMFHLSSGDYPGDAAETTLLVMKNAANDLEIGCKAFISNFLDIFNADGIPAEQLAAIPWFAPYLKHQQPGICTKQFCGEQFNVSSSAAAGGEVVVMEYDALCMRTCGVCDHTFM